MATLSEEIVAYESMQRSLEIDHFGKWVVIHNKELSGVFDSFENAAEDAVERFGSGPYLIREVGASSVTLPPSVLYRPVIDNISTAANDRPPIHCEQ